MAQVTAWELQRSEGGWRLPIEQRAVSRCVVDHAFALEFHAGHEKVVLRIEGAFTVFDGGRAHELTPAAPIELGPALGLFGQVVRSARASATGTLELAFEDGRKLAVEPDSRYEAWEISGPSGMHAVCAPGGELSIWQPKQERSPPES